MKCFVLFYILVSNSGPVASYTASHANTTLAASLPSITNKLNTPDSVLRIVSLIELCPSYEDLVASRSAIERNVIGHKIDLVMRELQRSSTADLRKAVALLVERNTPRTAAQRVVVETYSKLVPREPGEADHAYNSRLLSWARVVPNVEKAMFVNRILFDLKKDGLPVSRTTFLPTSQMGAGPNSNQLFPIKSITADGIVFCDGLRIWEGAHPYHALGEFDTFAKSFRRRSVWWIRKGSRS